MVIKLFIRFVLKMKKKRFLMRYYLEMKSILYVSFKFRMYLWIYKKKSFFLKDIDRV